MTLPYSKTGTICSGAECQQYQLVWKELFIAKSNITEDFFSRHINVYSSKIVKSPAHEYFYIYYNVTVDWVTTNSLDSFLIKTNGLEFPQIQVLPNQYLTKNDVKAFIEKYPYLSKINPITKQEKLLYTSIDDIKNKPNVSFEKLICPISFILDPTNGHIMLKATTQLANNPITESFIPLTNNGN